MLRSDCPSPEDLAAFLDGRLSAEARRAMVEHLDRCPDCYEVFSESARFLQEDAPRGRVLRPAGWLSGRRVTWAVASVAAVLLVLVLLPLVWSLRPAPLAGKVRLATTDLVGEMGQVQRASQAIPSGELGAFGFGGGPTEKQASFRAGARLLDLRVAARARNRRAAGDALDGLENLLPKEGERGGDPELRNLMTSARQATASGSFRSLRRTANDLEAIFETRLAPRELALGKWTEAGWLAAASGDRELFTKPGFLELPATIDQAALPAGALEKLRSLTASGSVPEGDLATLSEIFEAVKRMY